MVLRFSVVLIIFSLAFTLLSWGKSEPHPIWSQGESDLTGLIFHLIRHGLVGGVIALPTRRPNIILASALAALLIDVDHIGWLGLPTVSRSTHSFGFLLLITGVMGVLARKGFLGANTPTVLAAAVAGAAVAAHIAVDIIDTEPIAPLWAPLTFRLLELDLLLAVVLLGIAFVLPIGANMMRRKKPTDTHQEVREGASSFQ